MYNTPCSKKIVATACCHLSYHYLSRSLSFLTLLYVYVLLLFFFFLQRYESLLTSIYPSTYTFSFYKEQQLVKKCLKLYIIYSHLLYFLLCFIVQSLPQQTNKQKLVSSKHQKTKMFFIYQFFYSFFFFFTHINTQAHPHELKMIFYFNFVF